MATIHKQVDQAASSRETDTSTDESPNSSLLISMSMDHDVNQASTPREPPSAPSEDPPHTDPSSSSLEGQTSSTEPSAVPSSSSVDNQLVPGSDAAGSPPLGSPMTLGSETSVTSNENGAQAMGGDGNDEDAAKNGNFAMLCLLLFVCLCSYVLSYTRLSSNVIEQNTDSSSERISIGTLRNNQQYMKINNADYITKCIGDSWVWIVYELQQLCIYTHNHYYWNIISFGCAFSVFS